MRGLAIGKRQRGGKRRRDGEVRRTSLLSILRAGVAARFHPSTPTYGFAHPVAPADALVASVQAAILAYEEDLRYHVASGLALLPDYDLETGALLPAGAGIAEVTRGTRARPAAAPALST